MNTKYRKGQYAKYCLQTKLVPSLPSRYKTLAITAKKKCKNRYQNFLVLSGLTRFFLLCLKYFVPDYRC